MPVPLFLVLVLSPLLRVVVVGALLLLALSVPLALRWWRGRVWEELEAGYITVPAHRPYKAPPSWRRAFEPWNDAGIWVMDSRRTVVHGPDTRLDAPGFYPVSDDWTRLQLWNGEEWLRHYRHADKELR